MGNIDWDEIFEDGDPFEIKNSTTKSTVQTADERLKESFEEINLFIDENKRLPRKSDDILENKLFFRLEGLKEDIKKSIQLKEFDRHNLLDIEQKNIENIDDVFADTDFQELINVEDDIFDLKNLPKSIKMPEYIGKHKPCKDFNKFEPMFKECHLDIKTGKRTLSPFQKEQYIEEGMFFILKGVMVYIDKVGETNVVRGKSQARLRCIYENGTESDILNRSLARELYRNGRRISQNTDKILDKFKGITKEDKPTGYIYILKSLSKNNDIKNINNLYKIGYCETTVNERIKNAANEPTYLMAPVKIVAEYKTFNLNTQKFELLLHKFFGQCCVNIDVYDNNGTRHTVREWFQIPYEIINSAIDLLISGEIINYKYDRDKKEIVVNN